MLNKLQEFFLSIVLVILLFLLWNPMGLGMGSSVEMLIVLGLTLAFVVFAIFIWREKASDEREEAHFSFAGRTAFLAGSAFLVLGIIVQTFRHSLDMWLVGGLVVMVLAKMLALMYIQMKK